MNTQRSPHLSLPLLQEAQAGKHVTVNEALVALDALVQLGVEGVAATPPDPAPDGARWIVAPGAGGDWAGRDGAVAVRAGSGAGAWWRFHAPARGWTAWDAAGARLLAWDGAAWTPVAVPERVERIGVGTEADATNRLAVSAPATLLSHDGGDHRITVNKAGPADTASLLFQSGWSGRAEIGLAGADALTVKASGGAAWTEAMRVAPTGHVALPMGHHGAVLDVAPQAAAAAAAPARGGFAALAPVDGAEPAMGAALFLAFDVGATPGAWALWSGGEASVLAPGVPAVGDVADGAVGVAAADDGRLHVVNRHASARRFSVTWIGCAPAA